MVAAGTGGLLVIDKEAGWTSHDVVARCRRILGERRVGHAGTLDPDATGVLLVGVGRSTRLLRFLSSTTKSYEGEVVLGQATSTLDASGAIVGEWDMSGVGLDEVRAKAEELTGDLLQVPPMVSAVKVGGTRLHSLARRGIEVERSPRRVRVDSFEVEGPLEDEPLVYRIRVDCSSGTYVRVLASDLGRLLGGGAHLRSLRRTRVGEFRVSEARKLDEVAAEHMLTPAQALRGMEMLRLPASLERRARHGLLLDKSKLSPTGQGPWALVNDEGNLVGVYEDAGETRMRALVVMAG